MTNVEREKVSVFYEIMLLNIVIICMNLDNAL